jgi:hypothetical protein
MKFNEKIQQLNEALDVRKIINIFDYYLISKPSSLGDVDDAYNKDKKDIDLLVKDNKNLLKKLPVFRSGELIEDFDHPITNDFIFPNVPQLSIIKHKGNKYLVNTEGFEYPRYIMRIK